MRRGLQRLIDLCEMVNSDQLLIDLKLWKDAHYSG